MKEIKSYVIRGRLTAAQHIALHRSSSKLLKPGDLLHQWPWASGRRLCIEIGCGDGENIITMATNKPDWSFVGVDVYAPGLGKLLHRTSNIDNLRVFRGDHRAFFEQCLPKASIDMLMLFFPDPWPKKRHHKRRLINHTLLDAAYNLLQPNRGELWIATDWHNYAEHIAAVVASRYAKWKPQHNPLPIVRATTAFERKAKRAQRCIYEFRYTALPSTDASMS